MSKSLYHNILAVFVVIGLVIPSIAWGHGYHYHDTDIDTINIDQSTTNVNNSMPMTITSGVSDGELSRGIATAIATGAHQFDWNTRKWQLSVTGAVEMGGEHEEGFSFGMGKQLQVMGGMLLHGAVTQVASDSWGVVGATWRW